MPWKPQKRSRQLSGDAPVPSLEPHPRRLSRSQGRELLLYVAVGVVYIVLGVAFQPMLYSFVVGAGFLLLGVWILPALLRRLFR